MTLLPPDMKARRPDYIGQASDVFFTLSLLPTPQKRYFCLHWVGGVGQRSGVRSSERRGSVFA